MSIHSHIPGALALALFLALAVLMHGVAGSANTSTAAHLPDGPFAVSSLY